MIAIIERGKLLAWLLVLALTMPVPAIAQTGGAPAAQASGTAPAASEAAFTAEELEQVAAPIALYPDPLLAQVLMAATYPLEIVQAHRFVKANPNLKDDQLNEKLKDYAWDDSVKSLVSFPQVLDLMNEKLEWTQKLGDAVLAQQKELLDAVQRLRARAQAQGNLKETKEQKVIVEPAPAAASPPASSQTVVVQQPASIIKIEPASPEVVYVPAYNPTVVYGAWPYPAYPPYYPYPPGYAWGAAALSFGVGMAVGAAVWGNTNWGGGNVDVDVNKNSELLEEREPDRASPTSAPSAHSRDRQGNRSQWQHNPENRRGAQYRDSATQQKYNRAAAARPPSPGRPSAGAPSRAGRISDAEAARGRKAARARRPREGAKAASARRRRRRGPGIPRRPRGRGVSGDERRGKRREERQQPRPEQSREQQLRAVAGVEPRRWRRPEHEPRRGWRWRRPEHEPRRWRRRRRPAFRGRGWRRRRQRRRRRRSPVNRIAGGGPT